MSGSVAKIVEISASSPTSFDDAIQRGIERASQTLDQVEGAWIKEQKLSMKNGAIEAFRVDMMVTFILK